MSAALPGWTGGRGSGDRRSLRCPRQVQDPRGPCVRARGGHLGQQHQRGGTDRSRKRRQVRTARDSAMGALREVATETTQAMLTRLNIKASANDVTAAVDRVQAASGGAR